MPTIVDVKVSQFIACTIDGIGLRSNQLETKICQPCTQMAALMVVLLTGSAKNVLQGWMVPRRASVALVGRAGGLAMIG